jgi:hypothetical protein
MVADENRPVVLDTLERALTIGNSVDEASVLIALEIATNLRVCLQNKALWPKWERLSTNALEALKPRIRQLAEKHFSVCYDADALGWVDLKELAKWHGVSHLFRRCPRQVVSSARSESWAERTLQSVASSEPDIGRLGNIGAALATQAPPWLDRLDVANVVRESKYSFHNLGLLNSSISIIELDHAIDRVSSRVRTSASQADVRGRALFGLILISALYFELFYVQRKEEVIDLLRKISQGVRPGSAINLILARFQQSLSIKIAPNEVQRTLDALPFNEQQRGFISDWIAQRVELISPQ